ncbi:MAG: hypothetical protein LUM44_22510 [Pyrinomonadaceae bacterium]|nr:hypothetical protein [Pyrinomonadaceae bacterium]
MPENRKRSFNASSDRRQPAFSFLGILFCHQQTLVFCKPFGLPFCAAITGIADHRLKTQKFRQSFGNGAVSLIAGCQNAAATLLLGGDAPPGTAESVWHRSDKD